MEIRGDHLQEIFYLQSKFKISIPNGLVMPSRTAGRKSDRKISILCTYSIKLIVGPYYNVLPEEAH